jgi:hypothetical protein
MDDDDKSLNAIENTVDLSQVDFDDDLQDGVEGLSIDSDENSEVSA